jgi:2-polyprenyl-6-methoxyphenol hydroxylase-like FAD-dependent oxidoreductase
MTRHYDAIVVGARCAGAPTAMLLARRGYRVLLVDRATFPSDTTSTHMVHAPGVAALGRWGLREAVAASGCPPIAAYSFDFGPVTVTGYPRPADGNAIAYAPRRQVLDTILVEAAAAAGAEVRTGFTMTGVVAEDGVVTGIRGHGPDEVAVTERAQVVIGADGWNSRVARAVGASQYHDVPMLQWSAYSYWQGLPVEKMETVVRPDRGWAALPTNDGLTLLVVGWPAAEASGYRRDVEANYLATLELVPEFAERVRSATRAERYHGGSVPNFFRRPYGPGWALVGDAGYTRDSITAQGISDAFLDAESLADALDAAFAGEQAFDDALAAHHRARDARVSPMFEFTTQMARLEPPPPEVQQLLAAIDGNQAGMDAFVSVIAGTLSPADFFVPEHLGGLLAAGV